MDKRLEFNSMTLVELQELFLTLGEKKFRAEQFFRFLHAQKNFEIENLKQFSNVLIEKLKNEGFINKSTIYKRYESKIDNTKKYLIRLEDNRIIETVFMDYKTYTTVCISSQVGCRMGCSFCASTKENFKRNLTACEMLNQIYLIEKDLNLKITNVVIMGIGEPLDNYDNVLKFLNILNDERGKNLSLRNVTISTCGLVDNIYKLAKENLPITLTISLHNPFQKERSEIMPISNKYSIEEIIKACKFYFEKTKRRVSFEYTIIKGQNDSQKHAKELKRVLKDLNCHINIIPLNEIKEFDGVSPDTKYIYIFKEKLKKLSLNATIRKKQGIDINGACGQLRQGVIKEES